MIFAMVEMPSSISSVGRELVHSAMLRMPCLFWPATFQIFCGTLDGLVKVQKAYLMTLPKSTADQSIGMECRHASEPSSAMCVTCTLIAMLSRLMKKLRGTTDMRAVYCVLATCMQLMLDYMLLKQGERIWAVQYATAHAHASVLMLHTRPRLMCRSRLRSAPVHDAAQHQGEHSWV